ncbi:hypothetical protein MTIM_32990 [Mycobacterium timonense]|uniref:Uncharacterized protein n=1 Tax=Mycobacterium timonense TaxID=701043 RepID=A0A7I9Z8X6_9MYCO|nr:hypothetical protein MTIM_32990 [Mycobacterium timonense]
MALTSAAANPRCEISDSAASNKRARVSSRRASRTPAAGDFAGGAERGGGMEAPYARTLTAVNDGRQ